MLGFSPCIHTQSQFTDTFLDGLYELLYQRTLHSRPIRDLIDQRFAILPQEFLRRTNRLFLALGYIKNIYQVAVQRQVHNWDRFRHRLTIELGNGRLHFVHGNVRITAPSHWVYIRQFMGDAVHIAQLCDRAPSPIALAPTAARRQPNRKSFGEILVGMFLRVPTCKMANVISREWHGAIVVEITT